MWSQLAKWRNAISSDLAMFKRCLTIPTWSVSIDVVLTFLFILFSRSFWILNSKQNKKEMIQKFRPKCALVYNMAHSPLWTPHPVQERLFSFSKRNQQPCTHCTQNFKSPNCNWRKTIHSIFFAKTLFLCTFNRLVRREQLVWTNTFRMAFLGFWHRDLRFLSRMTVCLPVAPREIQ